MRFKEYINESKMGKLPQRIERTAYLKDYPAMLEWSLVDPDTLDQRANYKFIESIASKELVKLRNKGLIDFYSSDINIGSTHGGNGQVSFEETVTLKKYDEKKLIPELRKLKFKVIN